jgi:hypothetical protein
MTLGDYKLKMSKLTDAVDSKCLTECALKDSGCVDPRGIVQRRRNLHHANKVTDFEVRIRLHDLTTQAQRPGPREAWIGNHNALAGFAAAHG